MRKIKKVPAVERINNFLTKAGESWTTALLAMLLICGGIVGCGGDGDEQGYVYTAGREILYETANGELRLAEVISDNGNTLTVAPYGEAGEMQLAESKVLGKASGPSLNDTFTFSKGRQLDAYGDKYAEVEYLHGAMATEYFSAANGEIVAAEMIVDYGTTASGKEVDISRDSVYVLLRKADYWRE